MSEINLSDILSRIRQPARYLNREWNSYHHQPENRVKVILCFPDLYEIGASNLGIEILYHLLNQHSATLAERVFAPAPDLEEHLRSKKLPLFSLESKSPIKNFDLVGFSLSYELVYTNVLNMLELAGIPLYAAERQGFPLVIGGGPAASNPEPVAPFFDCFVIGEGEEVIIELVELVRRLKKSLPKERRDIWQALSGVSGVYVPAVHSPRISSPRSGEQEVSIPSVRKRSVDLRHSFYPQRFLVPFVSTVHSRLNIEIARGCPEHCRFCQARFYYSPWRERSPEQIHHLFREGIKNTGFEEVALTGLSASSFRRLEEITSLLVKENEKLPVSFSFPSLRCDQFSPGVSRLASYFRRSGLTFAPEAGSERLRWLIRKQISNQTILAALLRAKAYGWSAVKLYFMVGLPGETADDIEAIPDLIRWLGEQCAGLTFRITINPFIPKPHTPFQWCDFAGEGLLRERLIFLRSRLGRQIRAGNLFGSVLEAVFSRGDQDLAPVILQAWRSGCRFDQWAENLQRDKWQEAFARSGISLDRYLRQEKKPTSVLPWDHISLGMSKDFLIREYSAFLESLTRDTPRKEENISQPDNLRDNLVSQRGPRRFVSQQRVWLRFARQGDLRFLSHREQINAFRRIIRRTGLPLVYTQGFSPQPKMSFGPAISVGYASECEYVDVRLTSRFSIGEIKEHFCAELPEGFFLRAASDVPLSFPNLETMFNLVTYRLSIPLGLTLVREKWEVFFKQPVLRFEKVKPDGKREEFDLRPLLRDWQWEGDRVTLCYRYGPGRNPRPEAILQLIFGLTPAETDGLLIFRQCLANERQNRETVVPFDLQ